ncbi:MAG: hypothetical protein U0R52_04590 [Solirubrobacterales bacterium]
MRGRRIAPERRARAVLLAVSAGRVAIGLGAALATGPALRALGFPGTDSSGRALARLAGSRDIALGGLTVAARDDREALRAAAIAGIAVDAADSVSLGAAAARGEAIGRAGVVGAISGAAAALAGAWAVGRI